MSASVSRVYRASWIFGILGMLTLALSFLPMGNPGQVQGSGDVQGSAEDPSTSGSEAGEIASAEYGKALFSAKGCTGCHQHDEALSDSMTSSGPDLTKRRFDPGYLRAWLADPVAIKPDTWMPNLELSADEIDGLIAFLNGER